MENPLLGRKFIWNYETGFAGGGFEVELISDKQLTSKGLGIAEGFFGTMNYDLGVIAPNIFFLSYNKDDGDVISVAINLNTKRVCATGSTTSGTRLFMTGTVKEIVD